MASYLYEKNEYREDYDNCLKEQFGKCCWTCGRSIALSPREYPDSVKKDCAVCLEFGHLEENPHEISEAEDTCWV